jgi:2-polyprenyl-3-methyl-5-hydroxy-6-metoxy-1,4-benzoquinol methylase
MADQMTGLFSPFLRSRRIAAVRPLVAQASVLDFGCGVGELAGYVQPADYLGVDIDWGSIAEARRRYPRHAFQTLEEFESGESGTAFDVISALALVEHLPNPVVWLASMRSRLGPAGRIILTTPHPSMRWAHELGARFRIFSREAAEEHQDLLDRAALQSLATAAGLRMVRYRRFLCGCNQLAILQPATVGERGFEEPAHGSGCEVAPVRNGPDRAPGERAHG